MEAPALHVACYIVSWSMVETVGLLSVVTLKRPIHQKQGSVSSLLTERGAIPLCWPTLLNPACVNNISIDTHGLQANHP